MIFAFGEDADTLLKNMWFLDRIYHTCVIDKSWFNGDRYDTCDSSSETNIRNQRSRDFKKNNKDRILKMF